MKFEYFFEMPSKWTFKQKKLRKFILKYIPNDSIVLIPFAGKYRFPNRLDNTRFIYNDNNPEIEADYHLEAWDLDQVFENEYFDCIIADPPYSIFQFYAKYTKAKKEGKEADFKADYIKWKEVAYKMLKHSGIYIQLGYNSTGINLDLADKIALGICCNGSTHNDILILVQKKKPKPKICYLDSYFS
jgi:DNA modification methylase